MKTYLLKNESGVVTGFEIGNHFLGSGSVARFIKRTPGCTLISKRKMFSRSEIHATFKYDNYEFVVWEPFGDNSRLQLGSESAVDEKIVLALVRDVEATTGYFV